MKRTERPFFRYLIFGAEILLLWLLQATPKLLPEWFGAKPFLLLAAALSFSVCVGTIPAVVLGAVCGVLADISAGGTVGYFSVAVTLVCFAQASVLGTYLQRNAFTAGVLSAGSVAAVLGVYWLLFKAFAGVPDGGALFFAHYLPRILLTAVTFFPLYAFNRWIAKKL